MFNRDRRLLRYILVALAWGIIPLILLNIGQIYLRVKAVEESDLLARQEYATALGTTFTNFVEELWTSQLILGHELAVVSADQIKARLTAHSPMHVGVISLSWVSINQEMISSGPAPGAEMALRLIDLLRQHERVDRILSDLIDGGADQQPFLLVSHAVKRNGALVGVLSARVDPKQLGSVLPSSTRYRMHRLYDRQGRLVFDSRPTDLTWEERNASADSLIRKVLLEQTDQAGSSPSQFYSGPMLAASVPIRPLGFIALSGSDGDDVLRQARYDAVGSLGSLLLVIVMSGFGCWWHLEKVLRLERTVVALAEGDHTVRASVIGPDQFGPTGQAINKIATQMELEHHRLKTILEVLPVGIVVADSEGRLQMMNDMGCQIWGATPVPGVLLSEQTHRGRAWRVDTGQEVRPEEWGLATALRTGQSVTHQEFAIETVDGRHRAILNSAAPVTDQSGRVLGGVAVIVDITGQKQTEQELRDSRSLLDGQRAVLEMISTGEPLSEILQEIVALIERHSEESLALIMMFDPTAGSVRPIAFERLPAEFVAGMSVIPRGASDSSLSEWELETYIEDLAKSIQSLEAGWPMWSHALAHGLRSCMIRPIMIPDGRQVGILSVYGRQAGRLAERDIRLIDVCRHLTCLAFDRAHADDQQAQKLHSLITQMNEGVVAVDESGQIVTINPAARRLLHLTKTEQPQRGISELLDSLLAQLELAAFTATAASGRQIMRDTDSRQFSAYVSPVVTEVGRSGAIAILRDVTEETQLQKLQQSFVANVSHELRGPLTSLSVTIEALCDGVIPESERPRYLRGVRSEMDRLRRLSYDVVDISRLESGLLSFHQADFDLADLLDEVPVKWSQRCAADGITLQVDPIHLMVWADRDRVHQALANLIDNAIRFTPAGGVVQVSAEDLGSAVRVSVHDSGVGIPATDLELIWERFYKLDQARTISKGSGTGLGLSIVKQVIEAMGGTVGVESKPGRGSTFWFTLPQTHNVIRE